MIIYSKFNDARKEEFQLITSIINLKGKLFVLKSPFSEKSRDFMNSLLNKYNILINSKLPFIISKPTQQPDGIIFDYIKGDTIDDRIFTGVLEKSENLITTAINDYYHLIMSLPSRSGKVSKDFKLIFGNSDNTYNLSDIGCLDLTPENIILIDNKYVHFDYEWTFEFSIPLNYIFLRGIINIYKKYSDYNISKILSFKKIISEFKITKDILSDAIYWENNFQYFVHGGEKIKTPKNNQFLKNIGADTFISTMEKYKIDHLRLEKEIVERDAKITNLERKIKSILESRTWKLRNILLRFIGRKNF